MADVDASIPLQAQQVQPFTTLGNMANVAHGIQGLQLQQQQMQSNAQNIESQGIQLQSQRQANQERQAFNGLIASKKINVNPDGTIDLDAPTVSLIQQTMPQTGPDKLSQIADTNNKMTTAKTALLGQDVASTRAVGDTLRSLIGNSAGEITAAMEDLPRLYGPTVKPVADSVVSRIKSITMGGDPQEVQEKKLQSLMGQYTNMANDAMTQKAAGTPTLQGVNTGRSQNFFNIAPGIQNMPQGGLVASFQNEVPQTQAEEIIKDSAGNPFKVMTAPSGQKTIVPVAPQTSAQSPVATRINADFQRAMPQGPGGNPADRMQILQEELANAKDPATRAALQREIAAVPSTAAWQNNPSAAAQQANAVGTVGTVQADYDQTQKEAAKSAQNIGVLQNIKQYVPGAITGVAADRGNLLAGLASYLGMTEGDIAKTNSDLLSKNTKMLELAGGNTDAARAIAEAANPNTKMQKEAIIHAADQVIAQQQLPALKFQYMQQFKNDPDTYSKQLAQWNQVADPRILQWSSMTPQEKQQMKSSMNPQERAQFSNKMRTFEGMVGPLQ